MDGLGPDTDGHTRVRLDGGRLLGDGQTETDDPSGSGVMRMTWQRACKCRGERQAYVTGRGRATRRSVLTGLLNCAPPGSLAERRGTLSYEYSQTVSMRWGNVTAHPCDQAGRIADDHPDQRGGVGCFTHHPQDVQCVHQIIT